PHGVPHRRCGKLIVATTEQQLRELNAIREKAHANGVTDVDWIAKEEVARMEPELFCMGALHSPSTGIIDSHALMLAYLGDAEAAGAMLALKSPLERAMVRADGFELQVTGAEPIACSVLVNSAGLRAPSVAKRIEGYPAELAPRELYAKGNYYSLARRSPFSRLIYPVPEPGGLVVHVTLDLSAQAQTKWDMPTPYPDGNFHTKNVRQFAEDIAKATGGKLSIQVHSNGSLIKHPEIKRAVQTGQVPVGEVLISVLSNESPLFAFDSNPFLANSYAKEHKLWDAARPHIVKRLDGQGIELLYSVPWPPQGLYTKKEIHSLGDLKGTKFRTYSPTTSRFAERVGAIPTTIQVPDIPQAFRTGLVYAMITSR